ncbi:ABC transporter substrate-binding protein [Hymenobacter humi]|uniref:ABC transporter substrate-binding protein n=1 Tax=Hymenobacter humi TaxID=1411620 RepID=A0ABW2U123_9BACT
MALTNWQSGKKTDTSAFAANHGGGPTNCAPRQRCCRRGPSRLDFVIIPDAATATLALRRGDVDVFPQVPAREFARLRASPAASSALNFYSAASYDVVTAGFNTRRPALADSLTRRALSQCFDAAGLLKATQMGGGQRTVGIISPTESVIYNDSLALTPFDPQGAAEPATAGRLATKPAVGSRLVPKLPQRQAAAAPAGGALPGR